MANLSAKRFALFVAYVLGLWVTTTHAEEFRYRYVSFDGVLPPEVVIFDPKDIDAASKIYGDAYECSSQECNEILPYTAIYAGGQVKLLQVDKPFIVYAANNRGIVAGSVLIDTVNFVEQAALFYSHSVKLIPPQPGESSSTAIKINDAGIAVVQSFDDAGNVTYLLYSNGRTRPLDFGPGVTQPVITGLNTWGTLSGRQGRPATGFRFNPWSGATTLLYPLPTESDAWGLGINNRGDVLGYSFISGGLERIGLWNKTGFFKTYFVEGTAEIPTVSNKLVFNNNNDIVITRVSRPSDERLKRSYLVPKPGARLNIADLVTNLPAEINLGEIVDINDHGDMIGFDYFGGGSFLLKRVGWRTDQLSPTAETLQSSEATSDNRSAKHRALAESVLNRKLAAAKAAIPAR